VPALLWAGLLLAACAAGCERRPRAYDPNDARFALDVSAPTWCYEDGPLEVRVTFDCWSVRHGGRMRLPKGEYTYTFALAMVNGKTIALGTEPANPGGWAGDLKALKGAPRKLDPGTYMLGVAAALPTGKAVSGSFTREVVVRPRELRLGLKADKPTYKIGEAIVLTGSVENLLEKPIVFVKGKAPEVVLTAQGDRLTVADPNVPAELAPGKPWELFRLRFTAGQEDKRFVMGPRTEMIPLPFKLEAKYTVELRMSAEIVPPPASTMATTSRAGPAVRRADALAATVSLTVGKPKPPASRSENAPSSRAAGG